MDRSQLLAVEEPVMAPVYFIPIALVLLWPSHAKALEATELASECNRLIDSGQIDEARTKAEILTNESPVRSDAVRSSIKLCLDRALEPGWEYSFGSGRFISPTEQAERDAERETFNKKAAASVENRLAAEAAQRKAAAGALATAALLKAQRLAEDETRRLIVHEAIYSACSQLLDKDRIAALTNSVCVESFLTNGLPPG